jgi:hypothetical protein
MYHLFSKRRCARPAVLVMADCPTNSPTHLFPAVVMNGLLAFGNEVPIQLVGRLQVVAISHRHLPRRLAVGHTTEPRPYCRKNGYFDLSNYPKTLSSPGFYGGYTPFSDSYLCSEARLWAWVASRAAQVAL